MKVEEVEGQPLKASACLGRPVAMGFTVTWRRARSGGCGERERREVGEKEEARAALARSRAVGEARPWGSGAGLPALVLGVLGVWRRWEGD